MGIFTIFDPVNDRIARDIRNKLARVFVKSLDQGRDLVPVEKLAGRLLFDHPDKIYETYINDRQHRYLAAKLTIVKLNINEDFYRALVLWDNALFFETHEVLEALWREATGSDKLVLQAFIRAAGYYIHLGTGNQVGAKKMAARAIEVLLEYRTEVPPFPGLDKLLQCLDRLEPDPPKLLSL